MRYTLHRIQFTSPTEAKISEAVVGSGHTLDKQGRIVFRLHTPTDRGIEYVMLPEKPAT